MTQRAYRTAAVALTALFALTLSACGPSQPAPDTGQIGVQVRWATSPVQAVSLQPDALAQPQTVPTGVVTMRAVVSASDMATVTQDFPIALYPIGGTVNNVPAGSNRSLDLQGLDSSNSQIYGGTVTGITVVAGQVANAGTVTLTQRTLPSAPTNVSAASSDLQIDVRWGLVSGATSYTVYWSNSAGVTPANGTAISGISNDHFTQTLSNGTKHYYVVTAFNNVGESAPSAEVFNTAGSPHGLSATAGGGSISLTWYAITGATGYDVYRSTSPNVSQVSGTQLNGSTLVPTASYTDTTVVTGTTYYYIVMATGSWGQTGPSNEAYATP